MALGPGVAAETLPTNMTTVYEYGILPCVQVYVLVPASYLQARCAQRSVKQHKEYTLCMGLCV